MPSPTSSFLFTLCQVGAESALKKEIARDFPYLKFAYSRPGFLTFKSEKEVSLDTDLPSVFARAFGVSLQKVEPRPEKLFEAVRELGLDGSLKLHVIERDQYVPGEEPKGFVPGEWVQKAVRKIREAAGDLEIEINQAASLGDVVLDLVILEDEKDWWLGAHRVRGGLSAYPGGNPGIQVPAEAPSRAYLKLEEGILWSKAPLKAGDFAVEIGSAPGGACYSLLKRGLKVIGIDPGKMDPRVMEFKNFRHIPKTIATVFPGEVPQSVQWLLVDMNVKPNVSLFAIDRFAVSLKDSLLGVLLTIKLNDWKMADEIPGMIEHIRSMGMTRVKAAQLPGNGQEIFIAGLTRKGGLL